MDILTREWGDYVYAPPGAREGATVRLPTAESHHLFDVLRAKSGNRVRVTDGAGMVYLCEIRPDKLLSIVAEYTEMGESATKLTLIVGVLKSDSNREVVDCATQLGVSAIRFFAARRSEGKLAAEKVEKLERVALAAVKQCGRARIPRISVHGDLRKALSSGSEDTARWVAHPIHGAIPPEPSMHSSRNAEVIVGPEGGLTDDEVNSAVEAGYALLDLGPRRLRAETAVVVAASRLLK